MEKPTLFVRGDIYCSGYCSLKDYGVTCRGHVKEEDYDLSDSIVVDGDMHAENFSINGGLVVATGNFFSHVKKKER